ncbi:hypothetical protein QFC24_004615 [Naganishia onofrii]|uniref:Uncharacterized protein n=2 Tax=Naganishia onofrii TaxID=1851511 RepID=A0ACC2XD32_9TREE|nr:hypothetical protein QFC24_004610 [Naganishia onofrii]KAJ9121279.1 hypothetical protein QFC24_004615 [Naganishia onofrii]
MDIGLNDELNGLAEYDYDSPNHQNETWARSMARSALESQREMTGDCIIPTDVFAVIAEILAGSRDLETLAHLNIASRQIHAGTLPVLYETLVFSDEKALSNAFQRPPLGWKYTK